LDIILNRVRESSDSELTLFIPQDSIFYQNQVNKKVLQKIAGEVGKTIKFGNEEEVREKHVDGFPPSLPSSPSQPTESASGRPPTSPPQPQTTNHKPQTRFNLKLIVILISIFALFAAGAVAFTLLYLPKATIILFVEEKMLQKEETIEISPDITEIAFAEKKIPGKVLSVTEEEKKNFSATGTKIVGEKAKGKVTLQNWTDEETLLQAGTKITVVKGDEGEGLSFFLNSGVSVPAQTFSVPSPGRKLYEAGLAKIDVAAEDIGEKYNLSATTNFSIEGFAYKEFSAINETAFSGGLTREVIVVSEEDLSKAQDELKAKLLAKAQEDLKSKVLGDQKILPEVIAGDVLGANFSHEIGDETGNFELSLKTQSTATAYSESKLKELGAKILQESVPEGYQISSEDLGVAIDSVERQAGGDISLTGTFKTLVIPAFSEHSLIAELSGKRTVLAGRILDELPNIKGYKISFWPKIPTFLQILPLRSERISIEVETEK